MSYYNVNIKDIAVYYPENSVENQYFIDHFESINMDVEPLMNHLGRQMRYLAGEEETSLTMAYEACQKVLKYANLDPIAVDMIIFVSDTPEYTAPSNALKLNNMLGAKNAHVVYDINNNCIGMLTALDQVSAYLKVKKNMKNILVVGSLLISSVVSKKDPITYPNFGDGAAAVLLETAIEQEERGFIDSHYFTNSDYHDSIVMPVCGFSKIYDKEIEEENKRWGWNPFDFSFLASDWCRLIQSLLDSRGLKPSEIDHFVFSQFSKPDAIETLEKMGVSRKKFSYVGDEFGYTGVTSPIFGLRSAIRSGKIQKGASVILCSVGAGYTMCSLLYKF